MSVLVTGPSGFVGLRLMQRMGTGAVGFSTRTEPEVWRRALVGVRSVIHLAARVHQMYDTAVNPLIEFRKINVQATLELARQAAEAGARRFIFLSSVKVNGEFTAPGLPFRANDVPAPLDPYGVSKMEAEDGLRALAMQTGMQVVIIRPPLVYGPGVKANFASMVRWLQRGIPLPFGAIRNQRSLVALDNLVDLIITCIHHPAAANQTFMISDGEDVSTTELLRMMGQALGKPAILLPIPQPLLQGGARLVGKTDLAHRLFSSLQVNMELTRQTLNWVPPISLEQGLLQVARSVSPSK